MGKHHKPRDWAPIGAGTVGFLATLCLIASASYATNEDSTATAPVQSDSPSAAPVTTLAAAGGHWHGTPSATTPQDDDVPSATELVPTLPGASSVTVSPTPTLTAVPHASNPCGQDTP